MTETNENAAQSSSLPHPPQPFLHPPHPSRPLFLKGLMNSLRLRTLDARRQLSGWPLALPSMLSPSGAIFSSYSPNLPQLM